MTNGDVPRWTKLVRDLWDELDPRVNDIDWGKLVARLGEGQRELAFNAATGGDFLDLIKGTADVITDPPEISEITAKVVNAINEITTNDDVRKLSELLGALITEPFVSLLEEYGERENYSAVEFSRAFHGATSLLTIIRLVLAGIETSVFGFKVGPISEAFGTIYWNLGLGFLGWQTLAPLLSAGLQPKLTRYYNKKFRPNQFDFDSQVYRFLSQRITLAEFYDNVAEIGWSQDKASEIVNFGYRTLTRSDMKDLVDAGVWGVSDVADEFLKQGYNPSHIGVLTHNLLQETRSDDRLPSLSTARKLFREGLIPATRFRTLLDSMGYGAEAIDYEIALVYHDLEQEARQLTTSQVKQGFTAGELNETEVRNYLQEQGYGQEQIQILLNTWNSAKKPKILKLNKGSITTALTRNVINAGEAAARLRELGYSPADAQIIVDTALASGGVSGHTISISKLLQAFVIGAISRNELIQRLEGRGVSARDIEIYIAVATNEEPKELDETDVQQAFLYGVVDENKALAQLVGIGYSQVDAQYLVETWVAQRATFKLRLTPGLVLLYYRQRLIDQTGLRNRLLELGFSAGDADLMVQSADLAYPRELTSNEVQDLYFTGVIDGAKATALLQRTGLDGGEAQLVVQSWSKTLANLRPQPSISQYLSAYQDELLTEAEFVAKMKERGLTDESIAFYIRLASEQEIEVTRELTKADILGLYGDELLGYDDSLSRLIKLGYSADDSGLLLARKEPSIESSQVHKLFLAGLIPAEGYPELLFNFGYNAEAIDKYLTDIGF
jgi:SOS response regulatory protein OraA/RecX